MKVVFMGTPDFAVPTLKKLIEKHEVIAVFTQPDKPKGRGQKVQYSPVKEVALEHNIPVYQPSKIRKEVEYIEELKNLNPDVCVVVAYGQILPKEVLDIPKYGCINVHASLLPELRGAAPINWSIINGNRITGVTTMMMDVGLDTGDMLLKREVEILDTDTAGSIHDKLMIVGAELLIETLEKIEKGDITPEKQDDSKATYAPMMDKELGHINWDKNARDVFNLIRGVTPWPSAYFYYDDIMIKVWRCELIEGGKNDVAGKIVDVSKDGVKITCREGIIVLKEIQKQGSKRMDIATFLNGNSLEAGKLLK
ncbi:methionyl-tRNA formyltransferase [Caloramator proteoclasticus]|uniref:Methionyl-tRNA formyltransferase n=1 Tax=Caloramator proteoclasticus DSM 10124 TaxID=1121262 RepID=A0A1M5ANF3_9CLOT|nr:methionyl-tRNA formyltransferase [Caloramator proteoclasticus]SHF31789.1 methionyl-tRNA formyltransferase [Caloramator proteoclasticus DSM 10124]